MTTTQRLLSSAENREELLGRKDPMKWVIAFLRNTSFRYRRESRVYSRVFSPDEGVPYSKSRMRTEQRGLQPQMSMEGRKLARRGKEKGQEGKVWVWVWSKDMIECIVFVKKSPGTGK